jgi:hypothetical protein
MGQKKKIVAIVLLEYTNQYGFRKMIRYRENGHEKTVSVVSLTTFSRFDTANKNCIKNCGETLLRPTKLHCGRDLNLLGVNLIFKETNSLKNYEKNNSYKIIRKQ